MKAIDKIRGILDTECTTTFSGYPHPKASRFFYACLTGMRRLHGGFRAPNTTPKGNKRRRLNAVVEARLPMATTKLNIQEKP